MISFLNPAWLLLGLLAIPIIVFYLLRLRRREVEVSSTLLWQMLLQDRQANAPWQRLKRNLLLFLQLLILAALVLALARPAVPVPNVVSGSAVVILDASASMNAADVSPSRFEAARSAARAIIDNLPSQAQMTLILAGEQPQVLAAGESNKAELHAALDAAQPGQGLSDWPAAFALAAGLAGVNSSRPEELTTLLISDGGLPEDLPGLPGEVRYLPVGTQAENIGLRALAVRPAGDQSELYASVHNFGQAGGSAILSIYAGGELIHAQSLNLPAGESAGVVLTVPSTAGETVYEARLSPAEGSGQPLDPFPLDDAAYAVYRPVVSGRVLLASGDPQGNFFLEQVLAALPGIAPYRALPDGENHAPALDDISDPFDLYILDGIFSEEIPAGNLLLINPPPNPLFEVSGTFTTTVPARVSEDRLTRFLDWGPVSISQARQIQTPDWANVLVSTEAGPLVFTGETAGRRVAVIAFDLRDSDLPLQVAFPILIANLVDYLLQSGPGRASVEAEGAQPGDPVTIRPPAGVNSVEVTSPSGQNYLLPITGDSVVFLETGELGVYTVQYPGGEDAGGEDHFATNLFSPLESNIRPAPEIRTGPASIRAVPEAEIGLREYWPVLAGIAFAILLLEWWVYQRRQSLPGGLRDRIRDRLRARLKGFSGSG